MIHEAWSEHIAAADGQPLYLKPSRLRRFLAAHDLGSRAHATRRIALENARHPRVSDRAVGGRQAVKRQRLRSDLAVWRTRHACRHLRSRRSRGAAELERGAT